MRVEATFKLQFVSKYARALEASMKDLPDRPLDSAAYF
jgi:hypothetical protein